MLEGPRRFSVGPFHFSEAGLSFFSKLFNKGEEPAAEPSEESTKEADPVPPLPRKPNDRPEAQPQAPSPAKTASAPQPVAPRRPAPPPASRSGGTPPYPPARPAPPHPQAPLGASPRPAPPRSTPPPARAVSPPPRSVPPPAPAARPRPPSQPPPPRPPTAAALAAAVAAASSAYSNPFASVEDTVVDRKPPGSSRPATNWDMGATAQSPSLADTFQALLNDVDGTFGKIEMRKGDSQRPDFQHAGHLTSANIAEVRELFAQLAANHMRQVRDFMIDLKWGESTREWATICEPAVQSLRRAAQRLDLAELCGALDAYGSALEAATKLPDRAIAGAARDKLLSTYDGLHRLMPQAFGLETDRAQRESVILQSLLLQVPEVHKVTIDKLYAAGLSSLEVMFAAKVDDIVATTGIPKRLAEHIVDRFQSYRRELADVVPDATRRAERDRLGALVRSLRTLHGEFEGIAEDWSPQAITRKKELRRARDDTLLRAKVLLARLGEVDRLEAIERLPYAGKLAELERFLEEATEQYAAD